jgi:hypothetical protein
MEKPGFREDCFITPFCNIKRWAGFGCFFIRIYSSATETCSTGEYYDFIFPGTELLMSGFKTFQKILCYSVK